MSEIHYANKLKEFIADTIDPMFFSAGFKRSGRNLIRETNDVLVTAHIQKSRNNSSMYATFTIVGSVCLPNFARKMEIVLPSKFYSGVYDLYFNSEWYKMGEIPGFEPYRGLTEDDMNPNNPFQRYSWVWKDPIIVKNIIVEDITKVLTLIELLKSEEEIYHYLIDKANVPLLGQLFIAVKKMENGLVSEGLAVMEKLMNNQAFEPHIKAYLKSSKFK
ncbi:DUF4304 domain-containing protein [Paenibacillus prosopidis]|uniref:Uncharacterized protein DUF4304 n=1 Tax=Paenibacillus prosopidis TaxID=630520 RepID=A0A368VL18_9BACL|nr:DUF4304 domain-containing protein [Paenibacillus prosopidis]RCW42184.1 uncharacterized protein DUF4304 [Paenibacillus prosopidis]